MITIVSMKNSFYLFALAFSISFVSNAQLNDYKYIIVPKKLGKFSTENTHQTSTLLKHLLSKSDNGFNLVYEDALPQDLKTNRCLGLLSDIVDESSLFSTKLKIILKDCNEEIVFTSIEGKSKKKDFKQSYAEAMMDAVSSFDGLDYTYKPKNEPHTASFENDVKEIKPNAQKPKDIVKVNKKPTKNESVKIEKPVPPMEIIENKKLIILTKDTELLYAQPMDNGFQLIDSTPKVVFKLTKTSVENVFLASRDNVNGVVLKKEGKWFFEYTANSKKVEEELDIKF